MAPSVASHLQDGGGGETAADQHHAYEHGQADFEGRRNVAGGHRRIHRGVAVRHRDPQGD